MHTQKQRLIKQLTHMHTRVHAQYNTNVCTYVLQKFSKQCHAHWNPSPPLKILPMPLTHFCVCPPVGRGRDRSWRSGNSHTSPCPRGCCREGVVKSAKFNMRITFQTICPMCTFLIRQNGNKNLYMYMYVP